MQYITDKEKMMNRYIKFLMLSSAAALLSSCEGDRYALSTMIPDEYHTVLSFADTQVQENILYEGITNSATFKVLKGGSEPNSACSATVHILDNGELEENYGSKYAPIPQSMYSVSSDLLFPTDKTAGDITITFDSEQVIKLKEFYADLPEGIKPCIAVKVVPYKGTTVFEGSDIAISTFTVREVELSAGCSAGKMSLSGLNDLSYLPMADINKSNSISISMPTAVSNQWNIACTATYRPDLIEAYNEEYGTDYETLPEGVFSLSTNEITMVPGENKAEFAMQFDKSKLTTGAGLYLIPVRLTVNMLSLDTEELYIIASNPVNLTESSFSSPATATYDGIGLAGLCDNSSSFWHSTYKNSTDDDTPKDCPYYENETFGHYFQVRLDTPLKDSFRLAYWVRSDYTPTASAPAEVMLYYSDAEQPTEEIDTDNGWKLLDGLTKDEDNLPVSSGAFYLSGPMDLSETGQIRHLRFCVTKSNEGNSRPGIDIDTKAHTAIAEFKLWGK